jgi:hypothetical protein
MNRPDGEIALISGAARDRPPKPRGGQSRPERGSSLATFLMSAHRKPHARSAAGTPRRPIRKLVNARSALRSRNGAGSIFWSTTPVCFSARHRAGELADWHRVSRSGFRQTAI